MEITSLFVCKRILLFFSPWHSFFVRSVPLIFDWVGGRWKRRHSSLQVLYCYCWFNSRRRIFWFEWIVFFLSRSFVFCFFSPFPAQSEGMKLVFATKFIFIPDVRCARMPEYWLGKWFDVLMVDVSNREKELAKNMLSLWCSERSQLFVWAAQASHLIVGVVCVCGFTLYSGRLKVQTPNNNGRTSEIYLLSFLVSLWKSQGENSLKS